MLHNYLTVALRNLFRHKVLSLINVLGLALGMTCALLAILFVRDEFSYDQFHERSAQLYRLTTTVANKDGSRQTKGSSGQVQGPAFKEAIPEVLDYARILGVNFNVISEQKSLHLMGLFADKDFFKLFTFPLLHGNWKTALNNPNSIVLSEPTALKFFGKTDVVGKTLQVEDGDHLESFVVTAVTKAIPANSSIQFEVLLPFQWLQQFFTDTAWLNQYLSTFVLLHPAANPQAVEKKFSPVFALEAKDQLLEAQKRDGYAPQLSFNLQPITDIHLNTAGLEGVQGRNIEHGISDGSTLAYSYLLTGIVAFILLMACVNFINLSIGGSLKRAKEIGIRKVVGSSRGQIMGQFLGEAAILCLLSFLLAIILSESALPVFNQLADKKISISYLTDARLFIYGMGLVLVCVIVSGIYPAVVLSVFNPVEVLYNKHKLASKNLFGKSLIVLQVALAISLGIATTVYYRQMRFVADQDLGYDSADIIRVDIPPNGKIEETVNLFRQEHSLHRAIKGVAAGSDNSLPVVAEIPAKINNREIRYVYSRIDEHFLPMLRIQMKEGRNFSPSFGADKEQSVIVNEAFVKAAGWSDPIGKQFNNTWEENRLVTVVGVVKDYHYGSLKYRIEPQAMVFQTDASLWVKVEKGQFPQAMAALSAFFRKHLPTYSYQYSFLDEANENLYQGERRWQQIISYAAALSILICCIGLFGLAKLATEQRTKEIGIRKVLGANATNIVALLSKDFLKLVLIANVIAWPLAWWAMNQWLQGFAYRISIGWWVFVLTGMATLLIALLTVSFQAVKAALANPVKSLRTE